MTANKTLLQRKYTRIIIMFAKRTGEDFNTAMDIFYNSNLYKEMSEGISDMHCRSDEYLVKELEDEKIGQKKSNVFPNLNLDMSGFTFNREEANER